MLRTHVHLTTHHISKSVCNLLASDCSIRNTTKGAVLWDLRACIVRELLTIHANHVMCIWMTLSPGCTLSPQLLFVDLAVFAKECEEASIMIDGLCLAGNRSDSCCIVDIVLHLPERFEKDMSVHCSIKLAAMLVRAAAAYNTRMHLWASPCYDSGAEHSGPFVFPIKEGAAQALGDWVLLTRTRAAAE